MDENKRYLGDGVTVEFDGYQIWLRTTRENRAHEVALEDQVLANLIDYVVDLRRALRDAQNDGRG